MKRFRAPLSLVAGVLFAVTACGGTSNNQSSNAAPIEIGAVFDITGADAVYGKTYYEDAKLVFDDVNAHGGINGHKLDVHYEDDQSNAATAVQAANSLIDRDHVQIIYGGIFSPVALAIGQVAAQRNVLFFTPGSAAAPLTTPTQKYIFAVNATSDVGAEAISNLVASMKVQKVGFIQETDAYGQDALTGVQKHLATRNMKVNTVATIAANATDATSQVLKMKADGDQVIVLGSTIDPAAATVKAVYQQQLNIPIVSFGGGSGVAVTQLLTGSAPVEYYGITPLACDLDSGSCVKDFLATFKKAYPSESPSVWTAQGYVATQAFVDGMKRSKGYTPDDLVKSFESMPPFKSGIIPYPIQFKPDQHSGTQGQFLYGYKNGKLTFFGNDVTQNHLKT